MNSELALIGRIVRLAADPRLNLSELIAAVSASPRLASEVVRVANSCLYGMEGKIARLDRAALILGVRAVSEIAAAVLVSSHLRALQIGELSGAQLWLHSLEVAIGSELVARALRVPLESEAYLAGLLHDLGIPEMWERHGARYAQLIAEARERDLCEVEREALGETHSEHAARMAKEWGFPSTIRAALDDHHGAEAALGDEPLVAVVRAAHLIIGRGEAGWTDSPPPPDVDAELERLGLLPEDTDDIRTLLDERLKDSSIIYRP